MKGLKLMSFEADREMGIKCRFISEWFKIDSSVSDKKWLLFEILKNRPDVVLIDPDLYAQFELAEQITAALGITIWPMVEFEADDALATAAELYGKDPRVEQVLICSPDKDLMQCVSGSRIVAADRRRDQSIDQQGVRDKFGVEPESIPD